MLRRISFVLLICILPGIFIGCAEKTVEKRQEPVRQLSIAEQKEQAYKIYEEILVLNNTPGAVKNSPRVKELYREVIDAYPDITLAQESYLRLIIMAKEENTAAGDLEAEQLYQEFLQKYPDSRIKGTVEHELRN
jgi:hypothetical protein